MNSPNVKAKEFPADVAYTLAPSHMEAIEAGSFLGHRLGAGESFEGYGG
jgi:hypothetical protein